MTGGAAVTVRPSTPSRRMTRALKTHLWRALAAYGFEGRFPNARRVAGDRLHLLYVGYDKAGSSFFIEAGPHPRGELLTSWGERVAEEKLDIGHVPTSQRARLQAVGHRSSMPEHWFRFGGLSDDDARYEARARAVADLLPELDDWLGGRAVGPHISPFVATVPEA